MFQRLRSPYMVSTHPEPFYDYKTQAVNQPQPILKNSPSNPHHYSKIAPYPSQHQSHLQSQSDLRRIGSEKELQESHLKELKSILENVSNKDICRSQEVQRSNDLQARGVVKNSQGIPSNNYSEKSTLEKLHEFKQVIDRLVAQKVNSQSKPRQSTSSEPLEFKKNPRQTEKFGTRTQKYFSKEANNDRSTVNNRLSYKINSDLESIEIQVTHEILSLRGEKQQLEQKLQEQISKNFELYRMLKKDENDNESIIFRLKRDDKTLEQENYKLKSKVKTLELELLTQQQAHRGSGQEGNRNTQNLIMHLEREIQKRDDQILGLKNIIDNNMRSTNKKWSDQNPPQLQTIYQKLKPNPIMRQNNKLQIQINRLKSQNQRLRREKQSPVESNFIINLQRQIQSLRNQNETLRKQVESREVGRDKKQVFTKYLNPSTENLVSNQYQRSRIKKEGEYKPLVDVVKTVKNIYKY